METLKKMRIGFAGDRNIAVNILQFLIAQNVHPLVLMVSSPDKATHSKEIKELCALPPEYVIEGAQIQEDRNIELIRDLELDFIFGIHFPYLIPQRLIQSLKYGFLNLHPSYLPYNRGWHTPSWAILTNTPIGGTLHFMNDQIDRGDIVAQKAIPIFPNDTAHSLYSRIIECEIRLFKEQWRNICNYTISRHVQQGGSVHKKADLFNPEIQHIDLDKKYQAKTLIDKIRALTTSNIQESAYFIENGKKYHIQVKIIPESNIETLK